MTKVRNSKTKRRLFILGFLCLVINFGVIYSLFNTWTEIYAKKAEKKELSSQLVELREKEKELKVEVNKLNDPAYVAKYARERFYYSANNEYIIKIK